MREANKPYVETETERASEREGRVIIEVLLSDLIAHLIVDIPLCWAFGMQHEMRAQCESHLPGSRPIRRGDYAFFVLNELSRDH